MTEEIDLKSTIEKESKKEKIKYCIKQVLLYTTSITFVTLSMWFMIWITKELSYKYIYKDKVEQTIIEMVKPEYLKDQAR